MRKKINLTVLIFLLVTCSTAYAQTDSLILNGCIKSLQQYSAKHPTEKVHLHLDRPWYGLGDTIWFKAYTVVGSRHQLSASSGVLYAELITPGDTVLQRLILQLNSGTGRGDFAIPYSCKNGTYRIRAYTNWMRNDSAYFYDQKIMIGGIGPAQLIAGTAKPVARADNHSSPPTNDNVDIQFFPEGGNLVNGLRSRVAFKAINKTGLAVAVRGDIVDQNDNEVAIFSTQYAGMGQFPLVPQTGKHYKAKIFCSDGSSYLINLPDARSEGFTLTVNNAQHDSLYVTVSANDLLYKVNSQAAFYLLGQSGGKSYFAAAGKLSNRVFSTTVAKSRFPSGIARFTLFSQSGEPLNERSVFIQTADGLGLTMNAEKEIYTPIENVKLNLNAKDQENKATAGTFSVSVTNESKVPVDEEAEPTIFTDLLLTSDLKGYIENPGHYFVAANDQTRSDLDLLMLTQGYSRFEWSKILDGSATPPKYQPETALSLSGIITRLSNKPIANGKIRLTSVKDVFSADTLSDLNGNFSFTDLYLNDSTKVVINAKKANGGDNVKITVRLPRYPIVNKMLPTPYMKPDSLVSEQLLTALKKTYVTGHQLYLKNVIQLKEVKIKDRRNTYFNPVFSDNMKFSSNLNGPGNANEVILGDNIIEGGGGRLSDILPGKMPFVTFKGGLPTNNRNGAVMAIFIEGQQVSPRELDDINPFDIYSIEVLRSVAYLSIYGSNAPHGALIITLRHGVSPVDVSKLTVDGLITYNFNGFHKAREFYSPKYTAGQPVNPADDRKTIYWNPDIITDANGKASFEFFNAATPGTYRVVVEGIDGDGNIGRQVYRYKVE